MARLFDRIRAAVEADRYAMGDHAAQQLRPVVRFLSEVHERANVGDIEWIKTIGDVNVLAHARSA